MKIAMNQLSSGDHLQDLSQHPGEHESRDRKHEPEPGHEPALVVRPFDLEVDAVAPVVSVERRIRVREQVEVRVDVDVIAQEAHEPAVHAQRRSPLDECDDPVGERDEERDTRIERDPDQMRKDEKGTDEHRQTRAPQVVVVDEPDGVRARRLERRRRRLLFRCGDVSHRWAILTLALA